MYRVNNIFNQDFANFRRPRWNILFCVKNMKHSSTLTISQLRNFVHQFLFYAILRLPHKVLATANCKFAV